MLRRHIFAYAAYAIIAFSPTICLSAILSRAARHAAAAAPFDAAIYADDAPQRLPVARDMRESMMMRDTARH